MTNEEAAKLINECRGDNEIAHIEADKILCKLLKEHGYELTVAAFENLEKWYA